MGWKIILTVEMQEIYNKLLRDSDALLAAGDISHPKVKFRRRVDSIILDEVPSNPADPIYKLGNTMGTNARHWKRVKFNGRFRLFFWYNTASKSIVYAWLNDENTLRKSGAKTDPYSQFKQMLDKGNPPNDWDELLSACKKSEQ